MNIVKRLVDMPRIGIPFAIIVNLLLLTLSGRISAQYCEVEMITPEVFNFLGTGGQDNVWIMTFPGECNPEIDCPEWVTVTPTYYGVFQITCASNTGTARQGIVYVGNTGDFFVVNQAKGPLLGGEIAGDATLCYDAPPSTVWNSGSATGGVSPYVYTWQKSIDGGGTWTNVGASSLSYTPLTGLVITTHFRRKVTDNENVINYSNIVVKTVASPLLGGTISGDQVLCYNTDATTITSSASATGGLGSFGYQWQKSEYSVGSWSSWNDISGATSNHYDPPNLITTTKYRRRAIDNGGCGTIYSNEITKTVRLNVLGGSITGDQALCYNADASVISNSGLASGGSESFSYQWQKAEFIGGSWSSWSDIPGAAFSSYDPPNLTTTAKYRRRASDYGGCGVVYSNEVTKTVRLNFIPGLISGDQTLCYNSDASAISSTSPASGGTESFSYQWQKAEFSGGTWGSWSNISGATSSAYDPANLTVTTKYRRVATDSGGCGVVNSNEITKTVRLNFIAGSISGDQTLCYNSDASAISSTSPASGGTESFSYQWQKAEFSGGTWGSWSNISGATSTAYDPANLTVTTKYRRVATDSGGCGVVNSNEITKTVRLNFIAGSISGDQTLCYNTDASAISSTSSASGGTGSFSYQWQSAEYTAGTWGSWTSIPGATSIYFDPANLIVTTKYRRVATDLGGCGVAYSNEVTKTVRLNFIAGLISGDQTLCYNGDALVITSSSQASGGTESFSYQWQKSEHNGSGWSSWNDISGATSSSYDPPNLIITTKYRRRAIDSGGCGTTYSNEITKTVRLNVLGGSITGDQTLCYNADALVISSDSLASGGTESFSYQWQKSEYSVGSWSSWNDISGAVSNSYDPPNLITTTKYRRRAIDNGGCGTTYSNEITKTVRLNVLAGSITGDQALCYNADASVITSDSLASGGTGSFGYQWQKTGYIGGSWSSWDTIPGATSSTYDPGNLIDSTKYRRVATDLGGCGLAFSNVVIMTVFPPLSAGSISGDQFLLENEDAAPISSISPSSGGSGASAYHWQKSEISGSTWSSWSSISGASLAAYDPPQMTIGTRFRRGVTDTNGCGVEYSHYATIVIGGMIAPDENRNYIAVYEPRIGIQDTGGVRSTSISRIGVKYFDGLGRPLQDITVGHNGEIDLITPHTYDQYGRESVNYLPVPVSGNSGQFVTDIHAEHASYYNSTFSDVNGFAVTVFENSPLNRVLKQGAPGAPWQPSETGNDHSIKYDYQANSEQEVLIWSVDTLNRCVNTGGEVLSGRSYYPAGTLYKRVIKDENWTAQSNPLLHTTEEFTNMEGNVVLKRTYVANGSNVDALSTYYVYDYFNLLRYVLSPKASSNLGSATIFSREDVIIKGLCYYYEYDGRKRMVEKQLPGADPVYMVYDKRDRLVLVQDGILREQNGKNWLFTKYDMLNRPVLTGVLTHNSISSRASMQTEVDTIYYGSSTRKAYVERSISNTQHLGYENESFPNSTNDGSILYYTATYYDSYDFPDSSNFDLDNNISDYVDPVTAIKYNNKVKGLVTGSKAVVLGTSTFITTTVYYDDKYRPIQAISDLYVGSGGRAVSSTNYDFTGNPLQIRQIHFFQGSGSTMTDTYYSYDNSGRLLTTEHQIDLGTRYLLSENTYNETGQLVGKGLHKQGTDFLQDIDYDYNIRGWLTGINNPGNLDDDLFSMWLYYNDISALSPLTGSAQFNGNISGVLWNRMTGVSSSDTLKSSYSYLYDDLNRISNSYYGEDTGSGLTALQKYREHDYSYDLNGNIDAMKRTGSAGTIIDNLTYDYGQTPDYSNKLFKVTDSSLSSSGFNDGTNQFDDYEYDLNGNLKKDLNKGIDTITYNFLNLPELITMNGGTIRYFYDATGRKVSKVVTEGVNTTVRSYEGGFEYEDGLLSIIHTGEGFIDNTSTGYVYNYYLKDHLGNTRAVFSPGTSGTITLNETIDYYPFGLAHVPGYGAGYTKYKYNGKEIQDDLIGGVALDWYDYGARFYDPQIGRFTTIDPLTEKFYFLTPYQYGSNNPVTNIDIEGLEGVPFNATWLIAKWAEFKARAQEVGGAASRLLTGTSGSNVPANTIPGSSLSNKTLATWNDVGMVADGVTDLASGAATVLGNVPGVETIVDAGGTLINMAEGDLEGAAPYALGLLLPVSGKQINLLEGAAKGSLTGTKEALQQAKEKLGIVEQSLPKGKQGKFGSPQRGDSKKGYRLDPAHPDAKKGSGEEFPHINIWDFTKGKRNKGGIDEAIPIIK